MSYSSRHPVRVVAAFFGFLLALLVPAAAAVCAGADMRPRIEAERPGALAAMAAESAVNGDARLWRVTSPAGAVSHLYGTMHVTDPAIVALGPEAQAAYGAAGTVVIETTDLLDPLEFSAKLMARPELMFFLDGTDLTDLLDEEGERVVREALEARDLTMDAMKSFKPWVLATQLSLPACMAAADQDILDVDLALRARDAGLDVRGLETAVEQMEAMASLPLDFHVETLVETAKLGSEMDDVFATMGMLYAEGRIGEIWPFLTLAGEMLSADITGAETSGLADFQEVMVVRRNHTMAERVVETLEEGDAFVAVGALHLPGEEGLVALLRERGYTVDRAAP